MEFVKHYDTFYVTGKPSWDVVEQISKQIEKQNITILKSEVTKQNNQFHVSLVATFTGHDFQNITRELLAMPDVYSLYK